MEMQIKFSVLGNEPYWTAATSVQLSPNSNIKGTLITVVASSMMSGLENGGGGGELGASSSVAPWRTEVLRWAEKLSKDSHQIYTVFVVSEFITNLDRPMGII
jgi:hypothetical protein